MIQPPLNGLAAIKAAYMEIVRLKHRLFVIGKNCDIKTSYRKKNRKELYWREPPRSGLVQQILDTHINIIIMIFLPD